MLSANLQTINYNKSGKSLLAEKNFQQNKNASFGNASKSGLLNQSADFFVNKVDNILSRGMDQTTSNIINYTGKIILPPIMIFAGSKFTHEKKDSVNSSLLIHPLEAVITLGMATATSFIANKFIGKAAEKGQIGGDFFKDNAPRVKQLKSLTTLGMTFLSIPVCTKILSWALPKVKKKIFGVEVPQPLYSDLYAAKFNVNGRYGIYAESLRPQFGSLTSGKRSDD